MPAAYRRGDSGEETQERRLRRGVFATSRHKRFWTTAREEDEKDNDEGSEGKTQKRLKSNPATRFCWPATAAATQSMQGVRSTKDKN